MFSCEFDGYEAVVFGAFDGVTTWTNNAYINLGPLHQEVVSAHEERHLRLQKGTPWGALLMLLALDEQIEAVERLADACRHTHEAYATYLSTSHVADGLAALEGNALYLNYWRLAGALADAFDAEAPRLAILEYLFHLVMSPAALADARLDGTHTELLRHAPDVRLAAVTALLRGSAPVAASIAEIVTGSREVAEAQDRIAGILTEHGLPTLATADQLAHATRLMDAFNAASSAYRVHVAERSRATSLADQLDYQQHEVIRAHRDRARLEINAPAMHDGAPHPLTEFVRDDPQLGPHVWGVLLSSQVLSRQFVTESPEDDRYWGLLAVDRRCGPAIARLWPLPDPPIMVTEAFGKAGIAVVAMTTMSTLSDRSARIPFSPQAPAFVLVDLPVLPFLRGLRDEQAPVRWCHAEAHGDLPLHLVVLSLEGPDPLHFVIVRTAHTVRSTLEWLGHDDGFRHDPQVGARCDTHLVALARHLTGTFVAFDSTGAITASEPQTTARRPRGA